jgi:hypothetical protein
MGDMGKPVSQMLFKQTPSMDISKLIAYGIQSESSTHRVHVDLPERKLYIYRTEEGVKVLPDPIIPLDIYDWEGTYYNYPYYTLRSQGKYKDLKIATSRGARVDAKDIGGCREINIPDDIPIPADVSNGYNLTTTSLGQIAVSVTKEMGKRNMLVVDIQITEVNIYLDQIKGIDAKSHNPVLLQIKCDRWCSKNGLFLQTHEWNPFKNH